MIVRPLATAFALALLSSSASAAPQRVPRAAIEEPQDPSALTTLLEMKSAGTAVPMAVRVKVDANAPDARRGAVSAHLAEYEARGLALWLVSPLPASADAAPAWRTALQELVRGHRDHIAVVELTLAEVPSTTAAFAIRAAATDLHAVAPDAKLALGGPAVQSGTPMTRWMTTDLAAYVDVLSEPSAQAAERALAAIRPSAPGVKAVLAEQRLPGDPDDAVAALASLEIDSLSSAVLAVSAAPAPAVLRAVVRAIGLLAPVLDGDVDVLEDQASFRAAAGGRDVTADVPHRLLFDNAAFGTYLFYSAPPSARALQVTVNVALEGTPSVVDLARGTRTPAAGYRREGTTVHVDLPQTGRPMFVDFNAGATSDAFAARSEVSAERRLSVEEIIARHRQQQAAQDALVQHYAADVRMAQHFRPTVTDPGYDVVTDNRFFSGPDGVEWEERSFSVNGTKWGSNRPPFPLLQPEKVLSLPLQLRFSDDYRYRLDGTARVDDFDCYVVAFEPVDATRSLYRGRVWIDRATFARIKVDAVQTHLAAPVVSNQEVQHYGPVATVDGRRVFLLDDLHARQIVMIAGRNLLVERSVVFSDFLVNGPGFLDARQSARASDHVMYRDTDRGLRYFVKQGDHRVVSDRPTMRAKAMAMGVTIDPSFAFPLPIFGINYLNFAFHGPDSQFAMLFGGVLAAINIQRPKLGRTPFDASLDFFGIAVPSSDRRYDGAGEHPGERVITWPLTTGLNLGWQYTPFQKATFQYQFRFDAYHKDTTTADDFIVPSTTTTNGIGGAYEYRRGGYSLVANGAWYARSSWHSWGEPDPARPGEGLETPEPTYTRYSATISRDFYPGPLQKLHLNGAYFGGSRLDRFSRYQFGLFDDTRIHGVPASGVRFDELSMARGSYSFNVFDQYRLDLFLERAWGRDLTATHDWQPLTGVGVAVNLRAPFGTMLRADVGHAWLPLRYRGVGSTVVQVLVLKPLGS